MNNKLDSQGSPTSSAQTDFIGESSKKTKSVDVEVGHVKEVKTKEVEKKEVEKKEVNEVGGPKGLEPTRYGDWESKGRCYDF